MAAFFAIASLVLGLSMVLSLGGILQQHSVAILNSSGSTIYSTAYQDDFVKFNSLYSWMKGGVHWVFLSMAFVIIFFSFVESRARLLSIRMVVSFFVVLSVADVIAEAIAGVLAVETIFVNLLSNVVGAVVLLSLMLCVLWVLDSVLKHTSAHWFLHYFIALIVPVVAGMLLLVFFYYLIMLFYSPVPTKIEIIAKAPLEGIYESSPKKSSVGSEAESFGVLNYNQYVGGGLKWVGEASPFLLSLKKDKELGKLKARIYFFSGCESDDIDGIKKIANSFIAISDLGSFNLSTAAASAAFMVAPSASLRVDSVTLGKKAFALKVEEGGKKVDMMRYMLAGSKVFFGAPSSDYSILLSFSLLNSSSEAIRNLVDREILLEINGKEYRFDFSAADLSTLSGKSACRGLGISNLSKNNGYFLKDSMVLNILVAVAPERPSDYFFKSKNNEVVFSGLDSGWLTREGVKFEDIQKNSVDGELSYLQLKGDFDLVMDGEPYKTNALRFYTVSEGSLKGVVADDGKFRFFGVADTLYEEQSRLNKTRWERLDNSRYAVFALVPAFFIWLGTFVVGLIRKDYEFDFLKRSI
ncbi:hypothetical protein [Pseudomonas sp. NPDC085632]|uniref:hypothetical protein n=1 Tax=Pseudomonas sp. NPDC085632 TaxID=3364429 RepID=UPI0037CBB854